MKLKSCPFCGKTDKLVGPEHSDDGNFSEWWIECERCEFVFNEPSKTRVITNWNTRSPDPLLTESLEMLRGMVKTLDGRDFERGRVLNRTDIRDITIITNKAKVFLREVDKEKK